ncbi:GNAT family N-acetyltransferase [Luteimicrobium sp. DT211]|uniref:GNAT family N-acetyltransferase n=1 Tax=Luteimicrobium sp. DT211 TaxID=3393412 RepID=UPI003CF18C48
MSASPGAGTGGSPWVVHTERLLLSAVGAGDVDDLFVLNTDPAVWWHFPSGRHVDRGQTERFVALCTASWDQDGLGYWTLRDPGSRILLGAGGCMGAGDVAWNLYYRLRPASQGQGYASELVRAARSCAAEADPDRPVVARLLEHNVRSRAVVERAGLTLAWRGPDRDNPDPAAVRLLFADRELTADVVAALVGDEALS